MITLFLERLHICINDVNVFLLICICQLVDDRVTPIRELLSKHFTLLVQKLHRNREKALSHEGCGRKRQLDKNPRQSGNKVLNWRDTKREKSESDMETVNPFGDGPVKLSTSQKERANPSEPVAVVREWLTSPAGRFYSPCCVSQTPQAEEGLRLTNTDRFYVGKG